MDHQKQKSELLENLIKEQPVSPNYGDGEKNNQSNLWKTLTTTLEIPKIYS